ncbi:MAG TPA: hypothetical protein VFO55_02945 [Gemmatimonadaceae bacterium]|nr:hypothetical protein [Gemmatimonadaceae bacterium]
MSPWLVAVGAGVAFALLQYGWRRTHRGSLGLAAAALRLIAVTLIVALLLDAPVGRPRPVAPWVALDASESMRRGAPDLWRAALDSARAASADTTLLFGDSARTGSIDGAGADRRSELRPVVDRALASGRPIVVVTDGELADPDAANNLPAGSRMVVLARGGASDAALATFELPRAVVSGDTVAARIVIVSGASGSAAGTVALRVDGRDVARIPFEGLPPFGTRAIEARIAIIGAPGPAIAQAVITASGDAIPRNDTLSVALDRSRSASAVFVSTAPDFDSRAAIGLMRGALALPARGFLRVAPGVWRVDGTLAPIAESEVRTALREAPIAIIHGDTAAFGAPSAATAAPYALLVPVTDTSAEWYVTGTPLSPLTPSFAGVGWDSLPPLLAGGAPPTGAWTGMQVSEGRSGPTRALVAGRDTPRRSVTVVAGGFWRWQFRGGSSADAFAAFWGGIFDWLAGERADRRAAIPDAGSFRAGERIRWRRGGAADSVVSVVVRSRNGPARSDSLTLRFRSGATMVETAPMNEGNYDIFVRGGSSVLAVNPSAEWLPREVKLRSGGIRAGVPVGAAPRLRDRAVIYAIIIAALCAEWLIRRKVGLR